VVLWDTTRTQRIITTVWLSQVLLRRFTVRHPQHLLIIITTIIGTGKKSAFCRSVCSSITANRLACVLNVVCRVVTSTTSALLILKLASGSSWGRFFRKSPALWT
jgi:hypothetical protein